MSPKFQYVLVVTVNQANRVPCNLCVGAVLRQQTKNETNNETIAHYLVFQIFVSTEDLIKLLLEN